MLEKSSLLFFSVFVVVFACAACGGSADDPQQLPAAQPSSNPPTSAGPSEDGEEEEGPGTSPGATSTCDPSIYVADTAKWQRAGTNPSGYEMTTDASRAYCEKPGAHLRSLSPSASADGFGTFMDRISAEPYRGKRVRLRGVVETANVGGWSGLWLRVDSSTKEMLAFDNMGKRALRGTLPRAEHAVVLDVPNESAWLAFGVLLSGSGEVWTEKVVIEVVGADVPTTGS